MKARGFWNDENGMTSDDLEKIVLLILSIVSVVVCLIMYCIRGDITPNAVYLSVGILTLLVTRKGLSYFKPERYFGNDTNADIVKANNPEMNPYGSMYGNSYGGYDTSSMYGNGYNTGYNNYGTNTNVNVENQEVNPVDTQPQG